MRPLYPEELVSSARELVERPEAATGGRWVRAAAFLARQAMEELLAEVWRKRAPGLEAVSVRAQLICLPGYLRDEELSRKLNLAYWALSRTCHHHAYELTPTASELVHWIEIVAAFARRREVRL